MRFVTLLAIAGFSTACITTLTEDAETPPAKEDASTPAKDTQKPTGPHRVLMNCEFGCPAVMPYVNIMPFVVDAGDTTDTIDTFDDIDAKADADAGVTSPDACGDTYDFSTCCGNGVCERSESSFFCPGDCS